MTFKEIITLPPVLTLGGAAVIFARGRAAGIDMPMLNWFGAALIVISLGLIIASALVFRTYKTPIIPDRTPEALITSGPFAKSRNPIYLSMLFVLLGLGLIFGTFWAIPVAAIFAFLVTKFHIHPEEAVLRAQYPQDAPRYFARTPRWIGPF